MRGVFFLNGIVSYENVKCKLFLKCFLSGHQLFAELVPRSGREILNFCDAFYYKNVIFRLYLEFFLHMFPAMSLRSCAAKRRKILRSYALFRFRKRKFGRFGRSVWGGPKDTLRAFGGGHGPVAPPLDPRLE